MTIQTKTHVLLVEDETNVRTSLADYLHREGFTISEAVTGQEANEKLLETARPEAKPDIILLDWMLPDTQGIELLRQWRALGIRIPTILLTARAEVTDKVLGLELGANDYLTKPFEPRELVARMRVQLRPKEQKHVLGATQLENHPSGIILNHRTREVFYRQKPISLTKTEFDLLKVFLENPNQVFSREDLLRQVWGYGQSSLHSLPTTRTVDTHVLQLRQKTSNELFETVHRIGYRFRPTRDFAIP